MGSRLLQGLFLFALLSSLCVCGSAVLWGNFDRNPGAHNVRGRVRLLNRKTIRLEEFHWDGGGIAVYAYYYRPGQAVNRFGGGFIIPVPGSNDADGRFNLFTALNGVSLDLPLPDGVDACDIGTFTIWCRPAVSIFNQVTLTRSVFENDGADPCTLLPENIEVPLATVTPPPPEFDNCRFLHESLRLRWRVNREESNVRFQLCGCLSSNPNVDQYMAFGMSGTPSATSMFRADPTVTWVNTSSEPNAVDYHLSDYSQCVVSVGQGACPDTVDSNGNCTNDAIVNEGFRDDSQQCVTFTRPFTPDDVGTCDQALDPDNTNQHIVWGVGGLGETAFRHFIRAQATDGPLHLGRSPQDECGNTALTCQTCPIYQGQQIIARENTTFRAVIGPSGNERGYMGITGLPGWGIAFYINGILIPELVVQRGSTYTFQVEGGDNPSILSEYHPFYLTSSLSGGKLTVSSNVETVFAGFNGDQPTSVGRLCEMKETPAAIASRTSCQNLTDYLSKLVESSRCSQGEPGTLIWTPDQSTPDTVYYQCATHLNLGWKILVINEGDPLPPPPTPAATRPPTTMPDGAPPTSTLTALSALLCVVVAFLFGLN